MKIAGDWKRTLLKAACYWAPGIFVVCMLVPLRNDYIRGLMIALLVASALGWLSAVWSRPSIRLALLVAYPLPFVLLCLPERNLPSGRAELRAAYVKALQSYNGTAYWWGGETRLGIDCSGLIRAGMEDACFMQGLLSADGSMLRHAASLWLHDESAQALGEGYRGLTVLVSEGRSLNDLDYDALQAGDLAIAGGGVHILAYLGERRWIQADPSEDKVIICEVPSQNAWFGGKVKIVRWAMLARD
jgi:NlpC/P60 family